MGRVIEWNKNTWKNIWFKKELFSSQFRTYNSNYSNKQIKILSYSCQVRFAALITVLALAEKLKENYIVLLPESIPFLAELMEGNSWSVKQ